METKGRRYDIDWLRVIAFYLLILFSCRNVFRSVGDFISRTHKHQNGLKPGWHFYITGDYHYLFMISGIGVSYALGKRSPLKFIGERHKRLFIPLIFGMLVIIPPQIYFERLTQGVHFDSYFDFWKTVFAFIPYPKGGALSWHHLWFILYNSFIFHGWFTFLPFFS